MKKLIIFIILLGILVLFIPAIEAQTCTAMINGTVLANNQVITVNGANLTLNVTNQNNYTTALWNFTKLNSTIIQRSNNTASSASNLTALAVLGVDLRAFNETTYNLTATAYYLNATVNNTLCSATYTGVVIDMFDIAVPTISGPANNLEVTTNTANTIFNITGGRDGEQISAATLFFNNAQKAILSNEDVLATKWSASLNLIPEGSYNWKVRVTDTDGTTTEYSGSRAARFNYIGGTSRQLTPDQLEKLQRERFGLGSPIVIIILIAAVYFLFFRKGGK